MSVSVKFTRIVQEAVSPKLPGIFSMLDGPDANIDPALDSIINWFELPPYEKALAYYKSAHLEEDTNIEPMTVTYCYIWILKEFKDEVNINRLVVDDQAEYLRRLHEFFEGLEEAKEAYLSEIEKLKSLPDAVTIGYSTQIDIFCRAAKGAVEVIEKGSEYINALTIVHHPTKNNTEAEAKDDRNYWKDKENKFNDMLLDEVKRFFMLLANTNNKDGRPFLSESDVNLFIKRAFAKEVEIDLLTLDVAHGDKGKVCSLFYIFFHHCTTYHYPKKGTIEKCAYCQEKYIKLLAENFSNFSIKQIKSHFRRSNIWTNPLRLS
ncbi:hypothetical protein [Spirosoma areae]